MSRSRKSETKERFTFKKGKMETGLSAVGHPYPTTYIKHNGQCVGEIAPPSWRSDARKWRIRLMVSRKPTKAEPCEFVWKQLRDGFDNEPEARRYLNERADGLVACNLYHSDYDQEA